MKDALFGAILAIAVIVTGCTVNAKNSKYSQFQQEKAALSECDEYCYSSVMTVNGDKLAVTETIAKKRREERKHFHGRSRQRLVFHQAGGRDGLFAEYVG